MTKVDWVEGRSDVRRDDGLALEVMCKLSPGLREEARHIKIMEMIKI